MKNQNGIKNINKRPEKRPFNVHYSFITAYNTFRLDTASVLFLQTTINVVSCIRQIVIGVQFVVDLKCF